LAAVIASIEMARKRGVPDNSIATMLRDSGLSWDAVKGVFDTQAPEPTLDR
jgi:hypothetical protein